MMDRENIALGTPAAYREFIHEMLGQAQIQAALGMTQAEVADDVALEYAIRRFVTYTRAVLATLKDLKDMTGGGRDA